VTVSVPNDSPPPERSDARPMVYVTSLLELDDDALVETAVTYPIPLPISNPMMMNTIALVVEDGDFVFSIYGLRARALTVDT